MKETKSKSISDLFAESSIVPTTEQSRKNFEDQKGDENLFSGKKEKNVEVDEKAVVQSVPTLFQKEEKSQTQLGIKSSFSAKQAEKYGLRYNEIKEIGTGTVEGIGGRFFRKKVEGKSSSEKPIEIWFDPEEGGINDFIDRKLSEGFNFVPLRAIEMETGEILTVSCDRRIPCPIGRDVKVLAQISETGFVNFSLKVIRNKRKGESSEKTNT